MPQPTLEGVASRSPSNTAAASFERALAQLRAATVRPEVTLSEIPAPARIAPYAVALDAEVRDSTEDRGTGRFILLHDPHSPDTWEGTWRVVTYIRADVEADLASEPLLGAVGWSWLMEALDGAGISYTAEGGTVTRVISEGHAALAERETEVQLEIRASWTPLDEEFHRHLAGWCEALCTVAGMPPVPQGVVPLPGRLR